jgi:hypothetical protein
MTRALRYSEEDYARGKLVVKIAAVTSAGALTAPDYVLAIDLAVRSVGLTREVNH